MRGLAGRTAIVTGATKDMGEAVAERLAAEGMDVLCCGRDTARGEACAARIRGNGRRAAFLRVDVGVENDVREAVTAAVTEFGRLDVVVNLAAAVDAIRSGETSRVTETTDEAFQRQFTVNVMGPFWFYRHAIPEMARVGGGAFVNVSSLAAAKATPGLPAYSASKAALEGLSRQVAVDYGPGNIRSNCIAVGAIRTTQNANLHDDPVAGPAMRNNQMIDRSGSPDDIAGMVAFLASDESGFTTGEVVPVDGGSRLKTVMPDLGDTYRRIGGSGAERS